MKKGLVLISSLLFAVYRVQGALPKSVDAGIVVSVSKDFIDEYKNTFNMEFLKRMQ